ncbi:MAG: CidA/LrgA family protein [Burkholderiales bacterium]|nr:CidA/LrgA family protein [Burkholderiales bacterium]
MLGAITILLLFQLAGEVLAQALSLPVPGPVIGMALLLAALVLRGSAPEELRHTANNILSHLSILFIPGGVGVMLYLPRLAQEWLPILASLIVSTMLTLIVTALVLRALLRRKGREGEA